MIDRDQPQLFFVADHTDRGVVEDDSLPEAERFWQGESIAHLREQLERRREIMRSELGQRALSRAQAELGGGIEAAYENLELTPFAAFIEQYQPWKTDIATGLEDLRVSEVTPADIRQMTVADQRLFTAHYEEFVGRTRSRARLLRTPGSFEGEVANNYPFQNEQEMFAYGEELRRFVAATESTDVYELVHHHMLKHYFPERSQSRQRDRIHRVVTSDIKRHGQPVVVTDTHSRSPILRIQHVAA